MLFGQTLSSACPKTAFLKNNLSFPKKFQLLISESEIDFCFCAAVKSEKVSSEALVASRFAQRKFYFRYRSYSQGGLWFESLSHSHWILIRISYKYHQKFIASLCFSDRHYLTQKTSYRKLDAKYGLDVRMIHSWVMEYQGKNKRPSRASVKKTADETVLPADVSQLQKEIRSLQLHKKFINDNVRSNGAGFYFPSNSMKPRTETSLNTAM